MDFKIDDRLLADCSLLAEQDGISVLLHHNADVLWFILVPHTDAIEYYQLSSSQQQILNEQINRLSKLIKEHFEYDKVNVASIGNVVSQMHIHVVGRRKQDPYWPAVVWGQPMLRQHETAFIEAVKSQLEN